MRVSKLRVSAVGIGMLGLAQLALGQGRLITINSNTPRPVIQLDATTGAATPLGIDMPIANPAGLALDCATGTLYMVSTTTDGLYTVDPNTWVPTLVATMSDTSVVMHGLEWDSSTGTLYGGSGGKLYSIDPATATVSLIGETGLGTSFVNLGYDPTTDTLYGTYATTDSLYTLDRTTGAATLIGPLNGPTNPHGLTWNSDNNTMYLICSSTDNLYTVNLATGQTTLVGELDSGNYLCLQFLPSTPGCPGDGGDCNADFNGADGLTVADIFDFLNAWFAGSPNANFNNTDGVTVTDIFDFLNAWFAGCP